jgi:hypothetical protein
MGNTTDHPPADLFPVGAEDDTGRSLLGWSGVPSLAQRPVVGQAKGLR